MRLSPLLIALVCFSSPLCAKTPLAQLDVDELRIELDDLKYALHTAQVDLGLLGERLQKQDHKIQNQHQETPSLSQLASLEKKLLRLENTLDKAAGDLRTLNQSLHQALGKIQALETHFSDHEKRLSEVTKLKGTLTSISKAIGQRSTSDKGGDSPINGTYCVKAGDSLEKIARTHHIPLETLKEINHLSTDKILVGQELKLK